MSSDWHTVMDAVAFGPVNALGLDETLFARDGPFRRQLWSTQIVDVAGSSINGRPKSTWNANEVVRQIYGHTDHTSRFGSPAASSPSRRS